jgi:hypothetical protein
MIQFEGHRSISRTRGFGLYCPQAVRRADQVGSLTRVRMNRETAEILIRQYFQGWLQQDLSLVLSTLSPNIKIVECYGPVYCGIDEVSRWFTDWHTKSEKGKVTRWDIFNVMYDEMQKMAAVEWDFECIYDGNFGSFPGASLFCFGDTKIISVQEYRMEKEQYRPYNH